MRCMETKKTRKPENRENEKTEKNEKTRKPRKPRTPRTPRKPKTLRKPRKRENRENEKTEKAEKTRKPRKPRKRGNRENRENEKTKKTEKTGNTETVISWRVVAFSRFWWLSRYSRFCVFAVFAFARFSWLLQFSRPSYSFHGFLALRAFAFSTRSWHRCVRTFVLLPGLCIRLILHLCILCQLTLHLRIVTSADLTSSYLMLAVLASSQSCIGRYMFTCHPAACPAQMSPLGVWRFAQVVPV